MTIAQLFSSSIGLKHLDYSGCVELFNFLNQEAEAAIELVPDVVIDWDAYPIEDEEQELRWYAERCRWDAETVKDYAEANLWEFEYKDFLFTVDYVGNPLNEYQMEKQLADAEAKDIIRKKPVLSWEDFCILA